MTDLSHASPVEMLLHHAGQQPEAVWLLQPVQGEVRTWRWAQAADAVARMAAALQSRGWPAGSRIAIAGLNTAHWLLADLAIQMAGHIPVGLFPRQTPQNVRWILEHSEAVAVFMGPLTDSPGFREALPAGILRIGLPYAEVGASDITWAELTATQAPLQRYQRPGDHDLAMLAYTSGTTGEPKGVMISLANLAHNARVFRELAPANGRQRLFSYLPLAHMLERLGIALASLYWGAEVFFLERIDYLPEQLPDAEPTRFMAVPLMLSRLQSIYSSRIPEQRLRALVQRPLVGRLLRRRLVSRLGLGRVQLMFSGGAAASPASVRFFRDVLGIEVLECYGQTEALFCCMGLPGRNRMGSVGRPQPADGLRLSADGEIQVRHAGVMIGYYRDPEATAAAFTPDGWLRTGDLGYLDGDGYLFISGRLKEIFKTAKGKYVAPGPIERAFAGHEDIDQLCVLGSELTQPVLLVSLTQAALRRPRAEVEAGLLAEMERVNAPLEYHEKLAKLILVDERWTIENGLMTPTLKVRRAEVEARYADLVAAAAERRDELVSWR